MGLLFLASCLLLLAAGGRYKRGFPGSVEIAADRKGSTLKLESKNISNRNVESCVWYVGGEEAARTDKLADYTLREDEGEDFVRVEVTLKNGQVYEASTFQSVLPVLYLDSETAYDAVQKEENASVHARLTGSGYTPEELYEGEGTIHLRGNSTSSLAKRPFKLRLEAKAKLLGMSASRHWVLLANAIDASLLRNQLAYELSEALGAPSYIESRQVTLIYNGEYCGVYELCEQVRVEEGRVDVYNWDNTAEKTAERMAAAFAKKGWILETEQEEAEELLKEALWSDLSWLDTGTFTSPELTRWAKAHGRELPETFAMEDYLSYGELPEPEGGILLEMDGWDYSDRPLTTNYHMPFYFVTPREGETYAALYGNIKESLQALEYAFHSTDFIYREKEPHYTVLDEGTCNFEHDFARENVVYGKTKFSAAQYDSCHYSELMDMDSLMVNFLMCEFTMNWDGMKHSVFVYKDVDGPYYIAPAWDYDWAWGNSMGTYAGQTFDEGVAQLKEFMKLRLSWMDEQFATVESLRSSFGYYANSSLVWISDIDLSGKKKTTITVNTEVPECDSISLQVNGLWFYEEKLTDGTAVFGIPDSVLRSGKNNSVQARLVGNDGSYLTNPDGTTEGDYTNAISNYAYFTK